jgi:hypothetical protein
LGDTYQDNRVALLEKAKVLRRGRFSASPPTLEVQGIALHLLFIFNISTSSHFTTMYGAEDELSLAVDAFLTDAMGRKQTQAQVPQEGSTATAASRAPQSDKSFECTHPGCTKRFTRAEHLQRHALNHQPRGSSCDICRAHFKRPDLLSE